MPAVCWDDSDEKKERARERPGRKRLDAARAIQRFSLCLCSSQPLCSSPDPYKAQVPIIRAPGCKQQLIQIHQRCFELESLVYVEASGSYSWRSCSRSK